MQISIDHGEGHQIRSYQDKIITIDEQPYNCSLIVTANKIISPWPIQSVSQMKPTDCQVFIDLGITILVLGTGEQQHFLDNKLLVHLAAHKIGVEVMNTAAACRTYNVLAAEMRKVAAALIIDD